MTEVTEFVKYAKIPYEEHCDLTQSVADWDALDVHQQEYWEKIAIRVILNYLSDSSSSAS